MESITTKFFEGIHEDSISMDENNHTDYLRGISDLSNLLPGGVYVMDFQKRCLPIISHRDIFLCGHSVEHAAQTGYDFFLETVHPDDLPLFIKIHRAILKSEYIIDERQQSQIKYFYFTLRIKDYSPIYYKQKWLILCHKIKPVFINGKIRYGLCFTSISRMLTSGNLSVYFNDRKTEEYSFNISTWIKYDIKSLSKQDIEILRLTKQGFAEREIADQIGITYGSLRHAISSIYQKLDVKNMAQAVTHVSNHLMLFDFR
jgi:DNA-binding CsgD family transcriptional regulator